MTSFEEFFVFSWVVDFLFVDEITAENDLIKMMVLFCLYNHKATLNAALGIAGILFVLIRQKRYSDSATRRGTPKIFEMV